MQKDDDNGKGKTVWMVRVAAGASTIRSFLAISDSATFKGLAKGFGKWFSDLF